MNKLLVITVLIALLSYGVESYRVPRQVEVELVQPAVEEPVQEGTMTMVLGKLKDYYDHTVTAASGYLETIQNLQLEQKAMNLYDETTTAVKTYSGIVQDQIYHMFQ